MRGLGPHVPPGKARSSLREGCALLFRSTHRSSGALGSARRLFEIRHSAAWRYERISYGVAGIEYAFIVANNTTLGISEIWRADLGGGAPMKVCRTPAYVGTREIHLSGGYVYWADATGICRVNALGGTPTRIVSRAGVSDMGVDRYRVFYAVAKTIYARTITGGSTSVWSTEATTVKSLTVQVMDNVTMLSATLVGGTVASVAFAGEFPLVIPPPAANLTTTDPIWGGPSGNRSLVFAYQEAGAPWLLRRWQPAGGVSTIPGTGSLKPFRSIVADSTYAFFAIDSGVYRLTL